MLLCALQELRQRIRDSYEARWKAEKHFDEDQILNEMPGSLRIEVSYAKSLTHHKTFTPPNSWQLLHQNKFDLCTQTCPQLSWRLLHR